MRIDVDGGLFRVAAFTVLAACCVTTRTVSTASAHQTRSVAYGSVIGKPMLAGNGRSSAKRQASSSTTAYGFITDAGNNVVYIFNATGEVIQTLTGFSSPSALAVNSAGTLYVSDYGFYSLPAKTFVYRPPYKSAPTILYDPGQSGGVSDAVDLDGNLAEASLPIYKNFFGGPGNVGFYSNGATIPTNTVTSVNYVPNATRNSVVSCAFDAHGNLYITGQDDVGNSTVGEIIGGINGRTITPLTTQNYIERISSIRITNSGNVVIQDRGPTAPGHNVLYTYKPPTDGSLGSPIYTTPLQSSVDLFDFAFSPQGALVFAVGQLAGGVMQEFAYPAGGSPIGTLQINGANFGGIAIKPPRYPLSSRTSSRLSPAQAPRLSSAPPPKAWRIEQPVRPPANRFVSHVSNVGGAASFSDAQYSAVYVYTGGTVLTLRGFVRPAGLASDQFANLYVADEGNSRVQVYAPPYNGMPTTVIDPGEFPADVAVDSHGNIAATNFASTTNGPGSVSLYTKGSRRPTRTLYSPAFNEAYFCAFDSSGNLYLDGVDGDDNTVVGEIAAGVAGTAIRILAITNTIDFPGGIQVTKTGQVAIDDQISQAVYTYNPPVGGSLGGPVATTVLSGGEDTTSFAFSRSMESLLTVGSQLNLNGPRTQQGERFTYPGGGDYTERIIFPAGGMLIGVAISPTEQY